MQDYVEIGAGAGAIADFKAQLRSRVAKVQATARVVQRQVPGVTTLVYVGAIAGLFLLAFLGLYIFHQVFLWISIRPAYAFDRAKEIIYVVEVVWDSMANILNALLGAVDVLIPLWNSGANYVVEPAVYILLDVFALIFTGEAYGGLITEESVPYAGFDCVDRQDSQSWCGAFDYYENRLSDADASGSTFVENSIVLGAATSRRLSELTGEVIIPVLDLSEMTNGLTLLSSSFITILGSLGDALMHVVYTVLSEVAVLIMDVTMIILKELMKIIMMIVQSGIIEDIIKNSSI